MKQCLAPILLMISFAMQAQIEHLGRYELDHDWDNLDYVVISNQEKGVLVVQPQVKGMENEYPVVFHHLDDQLQFQWADSLTISRRLQLKGYHFVGDRTLLLFQNTQQNRLIKIVSVNTNKQEIKAYEPKNIVELTITEFEVIKNHAIIGGYIQDRPAVFAYDLENDKVRTLPNVFQNRSELIEVKINSDSLTFNVLSSVRNDIKDRTIAVNTYDYAGNSVRNYQLKTEREHQLLNGISSSIIDKEQVVVGLYCVKAGTFPSGLYVNHVNSFGQQTMRFYSFADFESFFEHEGERRADRLREKALDAKYSRKPWRYKIDVLFDQLVETEQGFLAMAEFYKPWNMNTQNYMRAKYGLDDFDPANRIQANREFYGFNPLMGNPNRFQRGDYDFTHALAFEINEKGELLWDDSMIIDEQQESPLRKFGAFQWSREKGPLYSYFLDEEIVSQPLQKDTVSRNVDALQLLKDDDKITYGNEEFEGVVGWFKNRFLIYGVHTVKDNESDRRKVFYLNAIAVK